jgi:hypothetical protein
MSAKLETKVFAAKTVVPINVLRDIRYWLKDNCKSRWSATDYKGNAFNWRQLGKMDSWESKYLQEMDITIMVYFKKPEDLMLYMLSWPSEVLLND